MLVDVILDTSELSANQAVVLHGANGRRTRVDIKSHTSSPPTSRNIVLERWSLSLLPAPPAEPPELPGLYKQGIVTFRALYALLRTLPSYPLSKKLRSRTGGTGMGGLKVALRIASSTSGESSNEDLKTSKAGRRELDLDTPLNDDPASAHSEVFTFAPVHTPIGSLFLECKYRKQADFGVEDIEALLSSRFFDEDFFRPTVEARQGSLPVGVKPASFGQPAQPSPRMEMRQPSPQAPEEEAEGAFVPKSARLDKGKAPELPAMDLPARKPSLGGSHPFKATPPSANSPSFRVASSPASTSPIPFPQQPDAFSTYYTGPSTSMQRLSSSPNFGPSSSLRYTSISRAQSYEPSSALSGSPSRPQPIQRYSSARYARSHSSGGSSEVPGQSSPAWGPDSIGRRARLGSNLPSPKPPEDTASIESFLALIDSKPTLQRGENVAKSAILSRSQADERLRVLAGSVYREGDEMGQGQQQRSTSFNSASESIRERMNRHSIEEERPTEEALAISPTQLPLPISYVASPRSAASTSPNFGHLQPSSYPRYVQPQHRPLHVQSGFQTAASASTSPQADQSSRMLPGTGSSRSAFPRYISSRERRSASEQSQPTTISPPSREAAAPSHRSPVFHDLDEGAIGRLDLSDEVPPAQAMFPDMDNNPASFAASRALPPSRDASVSRSRDRRGQARPQPQLPPYWAVRDKSREGKLGSSGSSDA